MINHPSVQSCFLRGVLLLVVSAAHANDIPKGGYVPDERTAVAIAEAVLVPVAGVSALTQGRPFRATLQDGIWVVSGTGDLVKQVGKRIYWTTGGPWQIRISKETGQVLSVSKDK